MVFLSGNAWSNEFKTFQSFYGIGDM